MKKFLAALILTSTMFISGLVYADATIDVQWSANTEADLAGYKMYRGSTSGIYTTSQDVGITPSGTFANVDDGTWFIAVTAYDTSGNESGYSNEVIAVIDTASPGSPANIVITITIN